MAPLSLPIDVTPQGTDRLTLDIGTPASTRTGTALRPVVDGEVLPESPWTALTGAGANGAAFPQAGPEELVESATEEALLHS
ncbi:hypothetical protein [Streptomyces sp. f150]|uniref:hypothetical protein n=1 Tax=Streptomyces sp. f150 TaxID=1827699 RepID=UPI000BF2292F|nr:hypothetical protein [Streptomyces sp. f150]